MKKLLFLLVLLLVSTPAWAATRTWDGGGANDNASTKENWSDDTAPTTGDTAVFDGTSDDNCTWDITAVLGVFNAGSADYDGTITLGSALNVGGNVTLPDAGAGWNASTYTVSIKESGTLTSNGKSFYNLTGGTSGSSTHLTITLADNATVTNQLDLVAAGSGYDCTWNGNKIYAQGKVTMSATSSSSEAKGTTVVEFSGGSNQDFDTALARMIQMPFIVNKSGGTVTALATANFWFGTSSSWTSTTGTVDFITNSTTVIFGFDANAASVTMTTQHDWYNVEIKGVLTLNTDITVNGYLKGTRNDGGDATINGAYKVYLEGDLQITNNAAGTDLTGTSTVEFSGGGNHTWYAGVNAGSDYNINISINKSGNTLTLSGTLNFAAANTPTLTYTAGTIDAGTSTLSIQGSCTLNTDGIDWYNITHSATNTTTLSSDLTLTNTLAINANTTYSGAYNLHAQGNITRDSTARTLTSANTTLLIDGGAAQSIGTTNGLGLLLPVTVNKSGNTATFYSTITFGNGTNTPTWTQTSGASTVDWTTQTSLFKCTENSNLNHGAAVLYDLQVSTAGTATVSSAIVSHTTTVDASRTLSISGTLTTQGDIVNNGTISGAGTISVSGGTNATQTFSGNGFTIGAFSCISPAVAKTLTFQSTKTYNFTAATNALVLVAAYGGNSLTVNASTGGSQVNFDLDTKAAQQVERVLATDNNATDKEIGNYRGTNTNTTNWTTSAVAAPVTVGYGFAI